MERLIDSGSTVRLIISKALKLVVLTAFCLELGMKRSNKEQASFVPLKTALNAISLSLCGN